MNQCAACELDFGSVGAFDAHRAEVHEYTYPEGLRMLPPREDGRRCLSEDELRASPRFSKNPRGAWSLTRDLERAPSVWAKRKDAV